MIANLRVNHHFGQLHIVAFLGHKHILDDTALAMLRQYFKNTSLPSAAHFILRQLLAFCDSFDV